MSAFLKEWLERALALVIHSGRKQIELKDLESCALSISKCDKIASECSDGEIRLDTPVESKHRLRVKMGLPRNGDAMAGPTSVLQTAQPKRVQRTPRPGVRRAKRDPISNGVHG